MSLKREGEICSLVFKGVSKADDGRYSVKVQNDVGKANASARLKVLSNMNDIILQFSNKFG